MKKNNIFMKTLLTAIKILFMNNIYHSNIYKSYKLLIRDTMNNYEWNVVYKNVRNRNLKTFFFFFRCSFVSFDRNKQRQVRLQKYGSWVRSSQTCRIF